MRGGQFLQHQIAPRPRAVGMFARIVVRRALDQADEQGEFADVEFVQGLGEVVFAAETEAVNGA